jgi:phosphoglycerate kinase
MLSFASQLLDREFGKADVPLPTDVVVGAGLEGDVKGTIKTLGEIVDRDMILDIGPKTAERYAQILEEAGTILWNGPVGVFEHAEFAAGTRRIAAAVAASPAFSIAGGGDTLAAIEQFGVTEKISYVSTGGGAFLEYLQGKKLPAVEMLETRARN